MKEAAADSAKDADPTVEKVLKTRDLQVGFEGSFGSNLVSPRGLLSSFLNSLVEVEGIVTKCSSVRPKLVRSVQYCAQTKAYRVLDHRDEMAPDIGVEIRGRVRLQTNGSMSREDEEGNQLETEFGLCQYKDYQVVTLQEMPERARVGQLPRSIEVIVEHDLVDRVKPGDRVQCVGVYQPLAGQLNNGQCSSFFRSVLMSNNISVIGKEIGAVRLTGVDVGNIRYVTHQYVGFR
jgi:DNA replication licensing factor MCM3